MTSIDFQYLSNRRRLMHAAQLLWDRHHPAQGYPPGVIRVPEAIPGLAFFPGGYGLWGVNGDRLPAFPVGGVMVVGHDFHSEAGYLASRRAGGERLTMPTWANLLRLLARTGIAAERCFFTNFYMGLRAGTVTTGPFPGAKDHAFVTHCRTFLVEQLREQRPALVLTLGVYVPIALAPTSLQLQPWASGKGLRHLDSVGPVRKNVTFYGFPGYSTTVAALTHPSLRHASVRHRRYGNAAGDDAELAIMHDAIAAARLHATS